MIINGNVQAVAGAYSVSSSSSVKRAASVQAMQKSDEVHLSSEGQSFSSMLQKLRSMDDVRGSKVQELSAKVADDNYNVSNENIAASLLGVRF